MSAVKHRRVPYPQKGYRMSHHQSALIVYGERPRVYLQTDNPAGPMPVIRFLGNEFTVQLSTHMTPAKQAAYLRDLAEQVADLAIQVERAAAGSAA